MTTGIRLWVSIFLLLHSAVKPSKALATWSALESSLGNELPGEKLCELNVDNPPSLKQTKILIFIFIFLKTH